MTSQGTGSYLTLSRALLTGAANAFVIAIAWLFGKMEVIAKVASSVSVLAGIVFGAYQYNRTAESKRVEQAFAYQRKFEDATLIADRQRIDDAIQRYSNKIVEAAKDAKTLEVAIQQMVDEEKIRANIDRVVYFYDELVYCIISDYCDPKITYDLFYPRAREYYVTLYSHILGTRRRSSLSHYGSGLETLASFKPAAR